MLTDREAASRIQEIVSTGLHRTVLQEIWQTYHYQFEYKSRADFLANVKAMKQELDELISLIEQSPIEKR